jgi:hypothetical protein
MSRLSLVRSLPSPGLRAKVPEGYVLLAEEDDKKDLKGQPGLVVQVEQPVVRNIGSSRGGRGMLKPLTVQLVGAVTATTAAGVAINANFGVIPSSYQDYAAFAGLYDEVKFVKGQADFRVDYGTPTGQNQPIPLVIAYDPIDGTAPTTVIQTLTFQQHLGPLTIGVCGAQLATNLAGGPAVVNRTGYWKFGFHMPKGAVRNSAVATNAGGEWMASSDAADTWGYLKVSSGTPIAAVTLITTMYIRVTVMFRSRQ